MREYKTQMEAARKGIVTEELKKVAQKEHLRVEELMPLVAAGKVAICANKNHKCLDPQGVGSMLRTKINVNLGVSRDWKDYDIEMQKVMAAVDMGADAIMDLSSHGDTTGFRRKLTSECPAMIGTVPVYDSVIHYQRDLATLTAKDFIDVVRLHAEDGVDFVTLHCGITRKTIDQIKNHKRKMNIVSRGGSLVFAWMTMTGEENPFYEYYDEILDICREYDVPCMLHTYINTARKLEHPFIHLPLFLLKKYQGKLENFREIGCSVHSVEDALEAQKLGATYLTAGHVYTTNCKKGLPPRGLKFLGNVCDSVTIPVYAIGGIHPGTEQISEVIARGAAGGCIMSDMMKI